MCVYHGHKPGLLLCASYTSWTWYAAWRYSGTTGLPKFRPWRHESLSFYSNWMRFGSSFLWNDCLVTVVWPHSTAWDRHSCKDYSAKSCQVWRHDVCSMVTPFINWEGVYTIFGKAREVLSYDRRRRWCLQMPALQCTLNSDTYCQHPYCGN